MKFSALAVVLTAMCVLFKGVNCRGSCNKQGQACKPHGRYTAKTICGERKLINEMTYDITNTHGYGLVIMYFHYFATLKLIILTLFL